MPIIYKLNFNRELELSVWKTVEPLEYFGKKLYIHDEEKEIIDQLSERKKLEWMASRYTLHLMSGRTSRGKFDKDLHGKPHLVDSSYHVSISHSRDLVAVIASPEIVGVDIQYFVDKISRISHKFVSNEEAIYCTDNFKNLAYHIIWGAKESLYKAYGKRGLDFKNHIFVRDLDLKNNEGNCTAFIKTAEYFQKFNISYHIFEEYILVYAKALL